MIRYVLCSPVACVSGRALAKKIAEVQGAACYYHCTRPVPPRRIGKTYVRYGTPHIHLLGKSLNHWDAVRLASDKQASLQAMEAAQVSSPFLWPDFPAVIPCVYRKSMHHAGNDNPYVVKSMRDFDAARAETYDYAVTWIQKAREFRVHVFCGDVIRVQKKCKKNGVEADQFIRSESRGWVLCDWEPDGGDDCCMHFDMSYLAKKAVAALGLNFGAVDICEERETGKLFALEVNSAPGLNDEGVALYAKACVEWDNRGEGA